MFPNFKVGMISGLGFVRIETVYRLGSMVVSVAALEGRKHDGQCPFW